MVEVIIALKNEQDEDPVDMDGGDEEDVETKVVKKTRKMKKACDPHKKRACLDCATRCARIHGRFSSSASKQARPIPAVPSFFKVMMGYFSESMEIPVPFAKTIMDLAGSNIFLEDSFGLRWRVRLSLRDGALSFGHGWKNFVLDHAVSCGEFLVFRQIARSVFTVQMFAPSAVERLYLCEKNQRQNRKRKPRHKKVTENNGKGSCRKKRRTTDHQHDQVPTDCKMSVLVCVDDSDVPDSAPNLKYPETSEKAAEAGAAESHKVSTSSKAFATQQGNANTEIEDDCTILTEHPVSKCTETENAQGSTLPEHVDAGGPLLAVMDIDEVHADDMYLSADMYEFEGDICNVDLNGEGLITNGNSLGFSSCLEDYLPNQHSSMEVGQCVVMSEVSPLQCMENNLVHALETCEGAANVSVPAHDIDINMLPAKEPSSFEENNAAPPTDAEVPFSECALGICNRDKCSCISNQAAQTEDLLRDLEASRFVPSDSSAMQDKPEDGQVNIQGSTEHHDAEIIPSSMKQNELPRRMKETDSSAMQDEPQDGQVNMQGSTEQHDAEIMPSSSKPNERPHLTNETDNNSGDFQSKSTEPGSVLEFAATSSKFCIAVPPPDQTWLELPTRLPLIPRRKKQGRKIVILKDPCMRDWPVLYQCTQRFCGFITGWVEICRENSLREGDTCEFEFSGNNVFSFQVRNSGFFSET